MSMVSLRKSACVIAAVVFMGCCFEQVAFAQASPNEAVLNRPFTNAGPLPDRGSWVWRDKKTEAPSKGFEGFVAYIRQVEGGELLMTIRLYDAPNTSGEKLRLAETYNFNVTIGDQVNNRSGKTENAKKNKSFHYILNSKLRGADGELVDPSSPNKRTFIITGTGLREKPGVGTGNPTRNPDRTLRLTSYVTKFETLNNNARAKLVPCTDYPDDAVLEEEVYSPTDPYPSTPDPTDDWLDYTW